MRLLRVGAGIVVLCGLGLGVIHWDALAARGQFSASQTTKTVNLGGFAAPARSADEVEVTEKTRKYGVEMLHDQTHQNMLYVTETGSVAAVPYPRRNFQVVMTSLGASWGAIRYQPATGRAWIAGGEGWQRIDEPGPLPQGVYEVVMAATGPTTFAAYRYNVETGATWRLNATEWIAMTEPQ